MLVAVFYLEEHEMLKTEVTINCDIKRYDALVEEYKRKLSIYTIEGDNPAASKSIITTSICVIIPFGELKLLIETDCVDKEGLLRYCLSGYLISAEISDNNITLCRAVVDGKKIYIYEKLYEYEDGKYGSFTNKFWVMNLTRINNLCNIAMNQFLSVTHLFVGENGKIGKQDVLTYHCYWDAI